MSVQTPTHVSLLQQLLHYFELAAAVGVAIPEPHVQKISALIGAISLELEQFNKPAQLVLGEGQTNQPEGFASPIAPTVLPVHEDGPRPITS